MVSMKDISKMCGVSIATVSKALNDQNDIGAETKERIRRVAKNLGYFPNSSALALKTKRTYNLGILFEDASKSGLTHDFFAYVLNGFKKIAESFGYDITFIGTGKANKKMTYLEHCRYRGFDGIVIACADFDNPEVEELIKSEIPLVTIDHLFNGRAAVISDNISGMRELVTYIYGCGHRRIAYIHGTNSAVTRNRLSSFFKTAEELGVIVPDAYVLEAAYRDTEQAGRATRELLALPEPPTCIIYPDDYSCFGGMNVIRECGLRIPEDISVAGYDGLVMGHLLKPQLTTLLQDAEALGSGAAKKLIELIEKPRTAIPDQTLIRGTLFEGQTVGRPRQ